MKPNCRDDFSSLGRRQAYAWVWKMAYFLTAPATGYPETSLKNRVWRFPAISVRSHPALGSPTLQPHRKIRPTATKPASGIPCWPSRDPAGERGGVNLYGFVGNDGVCKWDYIGLTSTTAWYEDWFKMQAAWKMREKLISFDAFTIAFPWGVSADVSFFAQVKDGPVEIKQVAGRQPGEVDPPQGCVWANEPVFYNIKVWEPVQGMISKYRGEWDIMWTIWYYYTLDVDFKWKRKYCCNENTGN